MNEELAKLADQIKEDIGRRKRHRDSWNAATFDLCIHLAEARSKFSNNSDFSQWLKENEIDLKPHERAAAIAMGQDPERLKVVLGNTQRFSLQYIYAEEWKEPEPEPEPEEILELDELEDIEVEPEEEFEEEVEEMLDEDVLELFEKVEQRLTKVYRLFPSDPSAPSIYLRQLEVFGMSITDTGIKLDRSAKDKIIQWWKEKGKKDAEDV